MASRAACLLALLALRAAAANTSAFEPVNQTQVLADAVAAAPLRTALVLDGGVTLVISQWLDYEAKMLWLDSLYPPGAPPGAPGVARGPCAPSSGVPADIIAQTPGAAVAYSKITVAPIGTTLARVEIGRASCRERVYA
jgi:hypothetical protein